MVDIVERLRSFRPAYGWPEEYATTVKPTLSEEAADEIERLRESNEAWAQSFEFHYDRAQAYQAFAVKVVRAVYAPESNFDISRAIAELQSDLDKLPHKESWAAIHEEP